LNSLLNKGGDGGDKGKDNSEKKNAQLDDISTTGSTTSSSPSGNHDGFIDLHFDDEEDDDAAAEGGDDDTDDELIKYEGDDEWGEFFGLGEGCKTLMVDYKSAPRLGIYIPNGTVSFFSCHLCGCLLNMMI
jgi:hypothetical protein